MEKFELVYNGKIKSRDQLYDEAVEAMVEVLENLDSDEQLEIGNAYREYDGYPILHPNTDSEIDEALSDYSPSEIIQMEYDSCADFFGIEYGEIEFTSYPWAGIEVEDVARAILDDEIGNLESPSDIKEIYESYVNAVNELENMNEGLKMATTTLNAYLNNQADVSDLLVTLSKLVRGDYWKEDEE
jgi:hypothetical protein